MPMGPGIGAGLLAGIAGQAAGPPPPPALTTTEGQVGGKQATGERPSSIATSTTSSLFIVTNPASFSSALSAHPSSVVMLRSGATKQPRPSIEIKFEEMAKEEDESNKKEVEFLVVDVDVGKGHDVAKDICGVDIGADFRLVQEWEEGERLDRRSSYEMLSRQWTLISFHVRRCFVFNSLKCSRRPTRTI
jgi:hypothetical protein